MIFSSTRLAFSTTILVAIAYTGLSLTLEPKLSYAAGHEKVLIARIVGMFAVVAAGTLMVRIERARRRDAVESERVQWQKNLELQKKAQEVELAAQQGRDQIAREIHDGIAQSIYALTINIETCADLAEQEGMPLRERLRSLVPIARKTLMETRHYIYDLKPLLSGESDLASMAKSQVKQFNTVAGTPVNLSIDEELHKVSVSVTTALSRILQEALANIFKHANASAVDVTLRAGDGSLRLTIQDNGVGFDPEREALGYGLGNMRNRAEELGGIFKLSSAPLKGTQIDVRVPSQEVENGAD